MAVKPVYIEREMIKSMAFRNLPSATAHVVLMNFMMKRKVKMLPNGNGNGKKEFVITNNGEIQYSYKEAEDKGITRPAFQRALDALLERGFLKIAHHGAGGKKGDVSLYEIRNEWRKWQKGEVIFTRPKDMRKGVGFALVHSRKKQEIGNVNVAPS